MKRYRNPIELSHYEVRVKVGKKWKTTTTNHVVLDGRPVPIRSLEECHNRYGPGCKFVPRYLRRGTVVKTSA